MYAILWDCYKNIIPFCKSLATIWSDRYNKLWSLSNIQTDEEGGVTDVCYAIEVLKKEAVAEELINSVENVMNKFQVSLDEACETLNHTVEQYNQAKELLENAKKEAENAD